MSRDLSCPADRDCREALVVWRAGKILWLGCPIHGGLITVKETKL